MLILIGVGFVARLALAALTPADPDIEGFHEAGRLITRWGFHFYGHDQPGNPGLSPLPYPPGYLPWLALISGTGNAFVFLERLPAICTDCLLAWLAERRLARAGAQPGKRLVGVALIAFAPSLIIGSGKEGHFGSLAIVWAVIACLMWEEAGPQRGSRAGLLIGLGATLKAVPIVGVVPLLATARSRKEALVLIGAAVTVPALAIAPFLLVDAGNVVTVLGYHGLPGGGGISLVLLGTSAGDTLEHLGSPILIAALAIVGVVLRQRRVPAMQAMVIVWLTVYIAGLNWYAHYAAWAIPFIVMSGALSWAAGFEALLAVVWVLDPSHHLAPLRTISPHLQHAMLVATWALIVTLWSIGLGVALAASRYEAWAVRWLPMPGDPSRDADAL